MEWFLILITFLMIVLVAGAISDLIGFLMRCIDEKD